MLRVENISVKYGKKIVLKNINITFEEGTLTGIVGPNGSGKSTFLKTLAALLEPYEGVVYVDLKNIHKMSRKELAKIMSVVLTERPDVELLKVKDLVALGRYPYTGLLGRLSKRDEEAVQEALRLVKADHLADRYFNELSDGEKQKVLIARALAQEPRILILDEPTTFLDIRHRMEIMAILRDIAKRKNIIIIASLHELDLASKFCDKIIIMKDGHIVAAGTPEEVLQEEVLSQVYSLDNVGVWSAGPLFEIKTFPDNRIFIVAGAGTGVKIYRTLARSGFGFCTGLLYEYDVDAVVAKTMNAGVLTIDEENVEHSINNALNLISRSIVVIDSGFPRTRTYRHNEKLIEYARELGREIIDVCKIPMKDIIKEIKKVLET